MSSRRTKIRYSLLALLVSYLREATTSTTKFTMVEGVGGKYPFSQGLWTFSLGSGLYQIGVGEQVDRPVRYGITIQFSTDRPDESQSTPQFYTTDISILIRVAPTINQESVAQQLATLIDQALFRNAGRCEIKDYDQNPSVTTGTYLTWTPVPRGIWEATDAGSLEQMELRFSAQYAVPESEW